VPEATISRFISEVTEEIHIISFLLSLSYLLTYLLTHSLQAIYNVLKEYIYTGKDIVNLFYLINIFMNIF